MYNNKIVDAARNKKALFRAMMLILAQEMSKSMPKEPPVVFAGWWEVRRTNSIKIYFENGKDIAFTFPIPNNENSTTGKEIIEQFNRYFNVQQPATAA